MKSYSKQDAHYMHIILFELDLYVKFPSLLLLKFLSDLKSTIISLSVFSWFLCRIAQLNCRDIIPISLFKNISKRETFPS